MFRDYVVRNSFNFVIQFNEGYNIFRFNEGGLFAIVLVFGLKMGVGGGGWAVDGPIKRPAGAGGAYGASWRRVRIIMRIIGGSRAAGGRSFPASAGV